MSNKFDKGHVMDTTKQIRDLKPLFSDTQNENDCEK